MNYGEILENSEGGIMVRRYKVDNLRYADSIIGIT